MRHAIILTAMSLIGLASSARSAFADNGSDHGRKDTDVYSYSMNEGHGRLGLAVVGITDELRTFFGAGTDGVLVGAVVPGSPAAHAGIRVGDVLTQVAGNSVGDGSDIWRQLAGKKRGDTIALTLVRNHLPIVLGATLAGDVPAWWSSPVDWATWVPSRMHEMFGDAWFKQFDHRLDQLEHRFNEPQARH